MTIQYNIYMYLSLDSLYILYNIPIFYIYEIYYIVISNKNSA